MSLEPVNCYFIQDSSLKNYKVTKKGYKNSTRPEAGCKNGHLLHIIHKLLLCTEMFSVVIFD